MTPAELRPEVVAERAAWIRERLTDLRQLPWGSYAEFVVDPRNPAAAESHLRRALEALLDLGRHLLAKRFARATTEYKEIAVGLAEAGVLDADAAGRLKEMAGYRNRLVHFYDRVTDVELHEICTEQLGDIEGILDVLLAWIRSDAEHTKDAAGDKAQE